MLLCSIVFFVLCVFIYGIYEKIQIKQITAHKKHCLEMKKEKDYFIALTEKQKKEKEDELTEFLSNIEMNC